jgi:hypothetical protein
MTATISGANAILRTRYASGLPSSMYEDFNFTGSIKKHEDFKGRDKVVALQTENPQGVGRDFPTALGSLAMGKYYAFTLTRIPHYGVVRITGEALKAAEGEPNAFVSLWKRECDGVVKTLMKAEEIYAFGNGSGVLGASNFSTVTATLTTTTDAAKFDLGMRVGGVSDSTTSPTVRTGYQTITGIDRAAGTLTADTNWTTAITGLTNGDYLVRAGDNASAATSNVIIGLQSQLVGGSSPGTLFSLNRTPDAVRLASQNYNATGQLMEDGLIDAEVRITQQGHQAGKSFYCHPYELASLKKSLSGKVTMPRTTQASTVAGLSFSAVEFEGDGGTIKLMANPFVARNEAFLLNMEFVSLDSLGPSIGLLADDGNKYLRTTNDDALEARFGGYKQLNAVSAPVKHIRITNWGA